MMGFAVDSTRKKFQKQIQRQLLVLFAIIATGHLLNAFKQPLLIKKKFNEIISPVAIHQGHTRIIKKPYFASALGSETEQPETLNSCCWKSPKSGQWEERERFENLKVGQPLIGMIVQEKLDARTGAKVWLDCGVCSINKDNEFRMVNGMHRLRDRKASVVKKKATRLRRKKDGIPVWVSRVFPDNMLFEVVVKEEDIPTDSSQKPLVPASSLQFQQELVGTVVRIEDYGVFLDVGANRVGLLHIQQVANLYDQYIDKGKGLVAAGLEKGAQIRVSVRKNKKKRLEFEFTDDVKAEAAKTKLEEAMESTASADSDTPVPTSSSDASSYLSADEAAAWADFATSNSSSVASISSDTNTEDLTAWEEYGSDEEDDYIEDDDYDEDRDIEDALGIGTY
mmetsp:Transcript_20111/g.30239  ORF Transcript_20111/g.30239 Transcript_20111/m.30239 type:complete len:395 (-) Transcript_20111:1401-2585(-)|eukprot:CAMPEP_0178902974 /NCGR_PEP_ID=MMETSP0786-20121207/4904_1 /TAXON_ID=186022 /ORGANISM="Thalassionema frauenfeldii, Strain CCMP 1798" /LENGTH=394 /DNA_ID=CAMNT_0020574303 /DNA_START=32 /DNA_END=1216 /DNA_ORIENTATION=-